MSDIQTTTNSIISLEDGLYERDPSTSSLTGIIRISHNEQQQYLIDLQVAKTVALIVTLILYCPITVLDLFYAYTDKTCVDIYPNKLAINMKIYLLVYGYYEIACILCVLLYICIVPRGNESIPVLVVGNLIKILAMIFTPVWNIIGSIIFWGTLYSSNACSRNIYNYLFATLIIKLLFTMTLYIQKKNKWGN